MFDWATMWRDFQEKPILSPILGAYNAFLNIRRYDNFPFYVQPGQKKVAGFEETVLTFMDHLVDGHELERNKSDNSKSFYYRSNYVARNFHRYSNDTMANLMFDTKLNKNEYDRLNSVLDMQNRKFYGAATLAHFFTLSYAAYFLRFRTLSRPQVLVVGTGFYVAFTQINSIIYKLVVDQAVNKEAQRLGLSEYIQPTGTFKARGLNYN